MTWDSPITYFVEEAGLKAGKCVQIWKTPDGGYKHVVVNAPNFTEYEINLVVDLGVGGVMEVEKIRIELDHTVRVILGDSFVGCWLFKTVPTAMPVGHGESTGWHHTLKYFLQMAEADLGIEQES